MKSSWGAGKLGAPQLEGVGQAPPEGGRQLARPQELELHVERITDSQ
jgi:hypothetical protein